MNKRSRGLWLYLMCALYIGAGIFHFMHPEKYLSLIPYWLPAHHLLINASGIAEIALGMLLIVPATRQVAAWLIIAMLIVFLLLIHIPHTYYLYGTPGYGFMIHLIRTPLQFVLIWWAWLYTKKQ